MANIRIPSNAKSLLPFCQKHEEAREDACFDTYAHLIVVAACLGYRLVDGPLTRDCKSFINTPSPIDLAIFRSQNLFSQLLIISMLCNKENDAALEESNLIRTVEAMAEVGLEEMSMELSANGQASLPETLAHWMIKLPNLRI